MPRPPRGAALLCAALFSCHASPAPVAVDAPADPAVSAPEADRIAAEAAQCIADGDLERARELLDELLVTTELSRAHAEMAAGSPADALVAVDRALALAPDDVEIQLLKADASLRLAEQRIQQGGGSAGLIEGLLQDAFDYYRRAGETAHALFGASRAAWNLGRTDEALELARRGRTATGAADTWLGELGLTPERILAEQVYAAYASARSAGAEAAPALFAETEEALGSLVGRSSDDPWAWAHLSDLYEWEGRLAEAKGACERGLARMPEDAGLLARLARVGRNVDGAAASVAAFERYVAEHPNVPAGRWHLAVARMQLALEGFRAEPRVLETAPFTAAEAEFAGLRARSPELAPDALRYEISCRLARGWCAFHAGDLARAQREFLSMNELAERGIESFWQGELESGIQGLYMVGDAYNGRGENLAAGEVFEQLHALQPEQYLWANNAGFFLRDAAVDLETEGKELCSAAVGEITNAEKLAELRQLEGLGAGAPAGSSAEREAFVGGANERFARAREIMDRSWLAYRPCADLVPDDVRVVNDVALVLVYYLHHDLDYAEQLLLRCAELGGPQVAAKEEALRVEESPERASLLEAELALLKEAWGDAHQNLGVLAWVHRKDRATAERWLEKSIEIWPDTRKAVINSLLPQVRGEIPPEPNDYWDLLNWAQPCRVP